MRGRKPPPLAYRRKPPRTHCGRGHVITGYNARPLAGPDSPPTCRACHAANTWAKRHNLFNDDPRVLEHAARLLASYSEKATP